MNEKLQSKRRNQYQKWKLENRCVYCGKEPRLNKNSCENCHQVHCQSAKKKAIIAVQNGMCRSCRHRPAKNTQLCEHCQERKNEKSKQKHAAKRLLCFQMYGNKCSCCGLNKEKYLQLDHIENDGAQHRKYLCGDTRGTSIGTKMYDWIIKNGFPKKFQLLCANCHQAKTRNQICTIEDHKHFSY